MAQVQVVELNHRHMAIAEYLLQHPSARLTEVAAAVGFSPSWVSIVTNSHIFREYMQQRNREIADSVHIALQEKVLGVAHRAVEKLGDAIDNSQDPAFILATADKTLQRLGYGAKPAPNVTVQNPGPAVGATHVDITVINQAREKVYALAGRDKTTAAAQQLPSGEQSRLGQTIDVEAELSTEDEAKGPTRPGSPLREEGPWVSGGSLQGPAASQSLDSVSREGK